MPTKFLSLCADDYGLAPNINLGIIRLAEENRLTAVSVMSNARCWHADSGSALQKLHHKIEIGLHLNFTDGDTALTQYSLKKLLMACFTRQINYAAVYSEIERQYELFLQYTGTPPDFIDGHQYVHQFPVIRQALLNFHRKKNLRATYIRVPWQQAAWDKKAWLKMQVVRHTGAGALKRQLQKQQILHNLSYAGIYDFNSTLNYVAVFTHAVQHLSPACLMVCHPAQGQCESDSLALVRAREYDFLASPQYLELLARYGVVLRKLTELRG